MVKDKYAYPLLICMINLLKKEIMILLQQLAYRHPDKEILFSDISLSIQKQQKVGLIGNNGSGKSTLLKIIAGELQPSGGQLKLDTRPYYIPQLLGQYDHFTIARALGIADKLLALQHILNGDVSEKNMTMLGDDWTIEERMKEALVYWQLPVAEPDQLVGSLSGGQKTKLFLAGISIHQPDCILMDEPGNHLDSESRELLYNFTRNTNATLLIVSHDRTLLNLLDTTCELGKKGITVYGGNYDFYAAQKQVAWEALQQDLQNKERSLRQAKEKERETMERRKKQEAKGKQKQEKAGTARIMMNTLRNNAEKSTAKTKATHAGKIEGIAKDLQALRSELPDTDKIKLGFDDSGLHKGKVLFTAAGINFHYDQCALWKENIDLEIRSGERISLQGANGSGKSTLIRIISGELEPSTGSVYRSDNRIACIDQDYSLVNRQLKVYEQAQQFNDAGLQEHEIKIRLHRFLFGSDSWDKPCSALSGGERMRLALCCLTLSQQSPDILVLDEPTNNLDIVNTDILLNAVKDYRGTLIVVSHDAYFSAEIGTQKIIRL